MGWWFIVKDGNKASYGVKAAPRKMKMKEHYNPLVSMSKIISNDKQVFFSAMAHVISVNQTSQPRTKFYLFNGDFIFPELVLNESHLGRLNQSWK